MSPKHLLFRGLVAAKQARPRCLPPAEQCGVLEHVRVFYDETKEHIEGDDTRFLMIEWDPKKSVYIVYDRGAKSARCAKVLQLQLIIGAVNEMPVAPDLVADQLDFKRIQAHMLPESTLLRTTSNEDTSKLMSAQIWQFILDDDLHRADDSFAGHALHKAMALLLEKSGVSQGAKLISSIASAPAYPATFARRAQAGAAPRPSRQNRSFQAYDSTAGNRSAKAAVRPVNRPVQGAAIKPNQKRTGISRQASAGLGTTADMHISASNPNGKQLPQSLPKVQWLRHPSALVAMR